MRLTFYDRFSSWMISVALFMVFVAIGAFGFWFESRPEVGPEFVPMEVLEIPPEPEDPGGFEDGDPNVTEAEATDSGGAPESVQAEQQFTDSLASLSTFATSSVTSDTGGGGAAADPFYADAESSPTGTGSGGKGGRPLGFGKGKGGGVPRELRWLVTFRDNAALDDYAKQLDFFGIELGVLQSDGTLMYVSNFSDAVKKRTAKSGKDEDRLYFTWQGGDRKAGDVKLFAKGGVTISPNAILFHFYPKPVEETLAQVEFQFAKRAPKEIRRTYFNVEPDGKGFKFKVSKQTYLKAGG